MSLLDNLVASYRQDDVSGSATDSVNGYNMTEHGTVGSATGLIGLCRTYTGGAYHSVADNADLSSGASQAFTIEAWIRIDGSNGASQVCLIKGTDIGAADCEWMIFKNDDPLHFSFGVSDGSTLTFVTETSVFVSVGTWYQVVGRFDPANNEIAIFVNDNKVANTSYTLGCHDSSTPLTLGTDDGVSRNMFGSLDIIRFWRRALSDGDVATLYNSGAGISDSELGGGGSGNPYYAYAQQA